MYNDSCMAVRKKERLLKKNKVIILESLTDWIFIFKTRKSEIDKVYSISSQNPDMLSVYDEPFSE